MNADIGCALYKKDKAVILDKKTFDGDFLSNFNEAVKFVQRNTRTAGVIKGLYRTDVPEIAEEALREVILNAMIHKDYFIESRILVEVYDYEVKVINMGKRMFKIDDFGTISAPRNLILMDCVLRTGLVERMGSGIKRILKFPPNTEFRVSDNVFQVIFKRNIPSNEGVNEGVNELYQYIINHPGKRVPDLTKEINIPAKTIERWLKELKEKELIEFRGSPKTGGYYRV